MSQIWPRVLLLGALLVVGGCATSETPTPPPIEPLVTAPPAMQSPQVEAPSASPGQEYVWVPGHWAWRPILERYVWLPGHWVVPPDRGLVWVPGHWMWGPRIGYHWVEGYWRAN